MIKRREKSRKGSGKIIIPKGLNVWPHEFETARVLAHAGYVVEFIRKSERDRETTADCLINGERWELKAPKSGKMLAIEKNLKRASRQSDKVVFDSRRMKYIPDDAIERELIRKAEINKSLDKVMFVNRHGKIVDIKT